MKFRGRISFMDLESSKHHLTIVVESNSIMMLRHLIRSMSIEILIARRIVNILADLHMRNGA